MAGGPPSPRLGQELTRAMSVSQGRIWAQVCAIPCFNTIGCPVKPEILPLLCMLYMALLTWDILFFPFFGWKNCYVKMQFKYRPLKRLDTSLYNTGAVRKRSVFLTRANVGLWLDPAWPLAASRLSKQDWTRHITHSRYPNNTSSPFHTSEPLLVLLFNRHLWSINEYHEVWTWLTGTFCPIGQGPHQYWKAQANGRAWGGQVGGLPPQGIWGDSEGEWGFIEKGRHWHFWKQHGNFFPSLSSPGLLRGRRSHP